VHSIGIYLARHGVLHTWRLVDIADGATFDRATRFLARKARDHYAPRLTTA
jgi:hypothetical protein